MTADEAHQEAYQQVLPKLRSNIMTNYVRKIVDAAKLHKDPVHKKIISTKRKMQEDDDYEAQEVIKYAVKKRKFLIQEATGTLSDEEIDYAIEDEEEERNEIRIIGRSCCLRWNWIGYVKNGGGCAKSGGGGATSGGGCKISFYIPLQNLCLFWR